MRAVFKKKGISFFKGSYQSGQMELTVTQLATPSVVRIHHCPLKKTNIQFTIAIHYFRVEKYLGLLRK